MKFALDLFSYCFLQIQNELVSIYVICHEVKIENESLQSLEDHYSYFTQQTPDPPITYQHEIVHR